MKAEIKELSKYGREIIFEVDRETIEQEKQTVVKQISNSAKIPGFRAGKVPENVIQTRYQDAIKEKLIENLVSRCYLEVTNQNKIVSIIEPEVSDVKLDTTLSFKVYVEIKPTSSVKKYKDLVVKKIEPEPVTNEDVEKVLTQYEKSKEFAISVIDPEKRKAWKEKVGRQLLEYNKQKAIQAEEDQLWEELLQNSEIEIPEKLLFQRTRKIAEEWLGYMNLKEKTKDETDRIVDDTLKKAKPYAEEQLKKYFILEKISEQENIKISQEEIDESLQKASLKSRGSVSDIKKRLEETGRMDDWKEDLKIDKTFQFIKNNSRWIEKIILPGEKNETRKIQ
ncbi:MAG: hypothetical protein M1501_00770 [Candidatus Omnitrophica bacterium]|nr:hypothetical protein [Candidatus Omnitrophota bacterium]